MRTVSIFLVIVALLAGMVSCAGPVEYSLTISATGGGEITTPDEGTSSYGEGTEVPLVALPHAGYRFVDWTGDVSGIADLDAASTTITMNGDYSISANFIKQYYLTISSTAGGSVIVPGEATYGYDEGEVVDLMAQADGGYHFVNWTGDVITIADVNAAITSIAMDGDCIITANFAVDLYFETDAYVALDGPATLPPEEREPCVLLYITTNMVLESVRVDLPDGRSVIVPRYTSLVSPGVDGTTVLCFVTCAPGMPVAGGEYVFTGVDEAGEPVPEARNTDVWVGVGPPDPPANVRAELTEDGILVSWDESSIIPGSFEPAAEPQLGFYGLWISRIETGEQVYGVSGVAASPHLIPQEKADFVQGEDSGLSLGEMDDGPYILGVCAFSIAPDGSLGKGIDYRTADLGVTFTIEGGEIIIG